jgi:regulator of protease activity HflC (stomatin/prohibitin superfamily)
MAERFDTIHYVPGGLARKTIVRLAVVIIAVLLLFWLSPFGTIAAGERGVHLRFSAVTGIKQEGLYFILPLITLLQDKFLIEANLDSKNPRTGPKF